MALQTPAPPAALCPRSSQMNACFSSSAGTTATSLVNASTRIRARRQRRRRNNGGGNANNGNNSNQSSLLLACLRHNARRRTAGTTCRMSSPFAFPAMPTLPSLPAMPTMPSMRAIPSWPCLASLEPYFPTFLSGTWTSTSTSTTSENITREPFCPCCPTETEPCLSSTMTSGTSGIRVLAANTALLVSSSDPSPSSRQTRRPPIAPGHMHQQQQQPRPQSHWPLDPSRVLAQAYAHVKHKMVKQHRRQWEAISRYCEQVELWHHDESVFGEHEYDQERDYNTQRSPQPFVYQEHVAPVLPPQDLPPSAYRMNQQFFHDRAQSQEQEEPTNDVLSQTRVCCEEGRSLLRVAQTKPVFVNVSVKNSPCAHSQQSTSSPHTVEPIAAVVIGEGKNNHSQTLIPGAYLVSDADMADVSSGTLKKKSTSNDQGQKRINTITTGNECKLRDRNCNKSKSMSQSPRSPPPPTHSTTMSEAMLKKDSRIGVKAPGAKETNQQQQQLRPLQAQGLNEPGPVSESHMARERFSPSDPSSSYSCSSFANKVDEADGNAPTTAPFTSSFSSSSLPSPSLPSSSSLTLAQPSAQLSRTSSPSVSSTCLSSSTCFHPTLIHPSYSEKDSTNDNMPAVTLSSTITQPPIPKLYRSNPAHFPLSSSLSSTRTRQPGTSLNRLLDTVLDHATKIVESQLPPTRDNDDNARSSVKPTLAASTVRSTDMSTTTTRTPHLDRLLGSKVRFFVESDDDESDTAETESIAPASDAEYRLRISNNVHHSDVSDCEYSEVEEEENETDDYFGKQWTTLSENNNSTQVGPSNPQHEPALPVRRQSLLSDLFMAERMLAAQRTSSAKRTSIYCTTPSSRSPGSSSRCHSAGNSDGETSHSNNDSRPQLHTPKHTSPSLKGPSSQSNRRSWDQGVSQHRFMEDEDVFLAFPEFTQSGEEQRQPRSPLMRTKRVFKNLDVLADLHPDPQLDGGDMIERSAHLSPLLRSRRPTIRPGGPEAMQHLCMISKTASISTPTPTPVPAFTSTILTAATSSSLSSTSRIDSHGQPSTTNINTPTIITASYETCRCKTEPVPTLLSFQPNHPMSSPRHNLLTRSTTSTSSATATGCSKTTAKNGTTLCNSSVECRVPTTVAAAASIATPTVTSPAKDSVAAAAAAGSTARGMLGGWGPVHVQAQIQSMYAQMASVVQRALLAGSAAIPSSTEHVAYSSSSQK